MARGDQWSMDSLKCHPGPLCPTLLRSFGRPPLKWSYGCYCYCGRPLPLWTPHASWLNGSVLTKDWRSENFRFEKGVFQGDPSGPIIFLACFNPILEKLESLRLTKGFNHLGLHHITLPFADDFNLLTGHKVTHQNIIKQIACWAISMGLVLKPRKCKSLSIKAGCSAVVEFSLGDYAMASIMQNPYMKFLGGFITYNKMKLGLEI
jgi:hypothetical protein